MFLAMQETICVRFSRMLHMAASKSIEDAIQGHSKCSWDYDTEL